MKSIRNVFNTMNALTGKAGRQVKALQAVNDWAVTVQTFLTRYDLYGSEELKTLIEKQGDAKFDLVGITYNGRAMADTAKAFKKTELPELVEVVVNGAEAIRRYLINPSLQADHLKQAVLNLRVDYERLQAELNRIIAED
jgi:hypothetical protein